MPGWVSWSRGKRVRGALTMTLVGLVVLAVVGAVVLGYQRQDVVFSLITDVDALLVIQWVVIGVGALLTFLFLASLFSLRRAENFTRTRWGAFVLILALVAQAGIFSGLAYELGMQRTLVATLLADKAQTPVYTPAPIPSPTESELTGTVNVLLIGADAAATRWGARTDSIAVAHINLETGDVLMIGIPRNLHGVVFSKGSPMLKKFPNGYNCGKSCMINAVYQYATGHSGLYNTPKYKNQDPGVAALREAVQGTLDITIDYFVMIDMQGFAKLVNRVGGVYVCVPKKVRADNGKVFDVGCQRMTGGEALLFARTRHDSSDYYRMEKQRLVQEALIRQINGRRLLSAYNMVATSGSAYIKTDISQELAGKLLQVAIRMASAKFETLELVPPKVNTVTPNLVTLRAMVRDAIAAAG